MHYHNFCTRDGDNFTLLIHIGNAHKQRMVSQTFNHFLELCTRGGGRIERLLRIMAVATFWSFSQLQK